MLSIARSKSGRQAKQDSCGSQKVSIKHSAATTTRCQLLHPHSLILRLINSYRIRRLSTSSSSQYSSSAISLRIARSSCLSSSPSSHSVHSSSLHYLLLKSSFIGESRLYTFSKSSLDAFAIVIPCVAISIKFKSYYWGEGQTGCSPPYIHFLSVPSSISPLWQEGAWLSGILSYL